jgi:hypothetical protein
VLGAVDAGHDDGRAYDELLPDPVHGADGPPRKCPRCHPSALTA